MNAKLRRGVAVDVATGIDRRDGRHVLDESGRARSRRPAMLSAFFIAGADCRASSLEVAYWCSGASQIGGAAGSLSRSCIAGAPELVEQVREDRQQVACRKLDRQAQGVAEPIGVEACNPCPHDVRPHTGLGKQLVQMGKLWIFPGECGRDQRCQGLMQALPDKSVLRLRDCGSAGELSQADDPLQVRRIHWKLSQDGALQTIGREI